MSASVINVSDRSRRPLVVPNGAVDHKSAGGIVAIDDDPLTLRLVSAHLTKSGLAHFTALTGTQGLELVDGNTAVVVVDLELPDLSGFHILEYLQQHHPNVQVVVLTGSDNVNDAVAAMRAGAFQFVSKPFVPDQFLVSVEKAIAAWRMSGENQSLKTTHRQNVAVREIDSTGDIHSQLMQQVEQIASLDASVFIGGETGTGKSTIARMIHQKSRRADGPFVTINCAALPRDLIQSELFGHIKGSFTGAITDRIGHAEVADGGTLFLDEIGDLPLDLQPKLLTFLQDRTVRRLGATESRKVDVRLITATHHDLATLCRTGAFRQDLYFRLLVLNLSLPALRFRSSELANIANSILASVCDRQSIPVKQLSARVLELLQQHAWPGNIRELENVLERAIAFSKSDTIEPSDLLFSNLSLDQRALDAPQSRDAGVPWVSPTGGIPSTGRTPDAALVPVVDANHTAYDAPGFRDRDRSQPNGGYDLAGKTLQQIERDAIIATLKMLGGNKAKSARTLGISEKSIYNKIKRLNISVSQQGVEHAID